MRRFPHPAWRVALFACLCALPAHADERELRAVREAIELLNAEQQALYQQFQMVQTLRLHEQRLAYDTYGPQSGPPRNYEDVVRERQAASDRAAVYQADMDELYERHREIELQKQPLLERLRALTLDTPAQ